jgi:ATP-dependent helicase/nuclease subunit A
MTRAIDRLIVSGSIDRERRADASTPIGWVLDRLDADEELRAAATEHVELERGGARIVLRVDRNVEEPAAEPEPVEVGAQLELFASRPETAAAPALTLAPLAPVPAPVLHEVRTLSFTALSTFERCSYRYYAERVVGMRPRARQVSDVVGTGLAATEVGDAVHRLLESVDLTAPAVPDVEVVRTWYPMVSEEELDRIRSFVAGYCESELAARVASLAGVQRERRFAFEHDGVLLRGFLDVFHLADGRGTVVDYKTNTLAEATPEEIVETGYRLQRLVYALACLRAGAEEVEVAYVFLERPDAVVSTVFGLADVPELETELSAAIAHIRAGDFRPTPSEFACAGCPALDLVCAGPRLPGAGPVRPPALATAG